MEIKKTEQKTEQRTEQRTEQKTAQRYAAILIRLGGGIRGEIKDTLFMLRLRKKNCCVIVDESTTGLGMLRKCKDFITYGEIDAETEAFLKEKRGIPDPANKGHLKQYFLLHPPRGGFGRKGIKVPFTKGGALGYRKTAINALIRRMI
ncbi:MAG: uL30 family ribosomal protein [Nanoarchaeota archaeon]